MSGPIVSFAPLTEAEIPTLTELQPPLWLDIRPAFTRYLRAPFCFPIKGVVENTVAAVGAAIDMGENGWLGHVIVHPTFRRQGIGTAIVEMLISMLRAKGCGTLSLVSTDEGTPLYARLGFVVVAEYAFYIKDGAGVTGRDSKRIRRYLSTDAGSVLRLDRQASGEDRSRLLAECLSTAWVYEGDRGIEGFFAPAAQEGLVVASNQTAGTSLLAFRARFSTFGTLPVANRAGVAWYEALGYRKFRRARRMVLGTPFAWCPGMLYSRVGGNLG